MRTGKYVISHLNSVNVDGTGEAQITEGPT